jgi:hypothetical protein
MILCFKDAKLGNVFGMVCHICMPQILRGVFLTSKR